MKNESKAIRYFLYARKSSESEDRQVQSIDDQNQRLTEHAKRWGLIVVDMFTEAKSAKAPEMRPEFKEMLKRIKKGEANGILCWKLDRLSRNPVDGGFLQWMLQQGELLSIQTIDKEYLREDSALVMSMMNGMANQYILDLSKNVKRGLYSKVEKGWLPNLSPLGYLNTKTNQKGENTIIPDPERFPLLRKAWDLMVTGHYTPPQILETLNSKWGFRTVRRKRLGDKPLSRSGMYRIFTNTFYCGMIKYGGKLYPGSHEPMITFDEFDRVQVILGRKGKPRPKKHEFPYTGVLRCEECGCVYTAETKSKVIKSTGEVRSYTYYHCTRKKRSITCTQRENLREENVEAQILEELNGITILPEFKDLALEILRETKQDTFEKQKKVYEMQKQSLEKAQQELQSLTRMRYKEQITDEEFTKERNHLITQIQSLKEQIDHVEETQANHFEQVERVFDFAAFAKEAFVHGGTHKKREIVMALGQNQRIKDGKLKISLYEWLVPLQNGCSPLKSKNLVLEPHKKSDATWGIVPLLAQNKALRTHWRRGRDSNPR